MHLNAKEEENDSDVVTATAVDEGVNSTDEERMGLTWEEMMADPELRRFENESSRKEWNAMLLPQRISQAVTTLGWLFVIGGVVLPYFGLAYVRNPAGGIGIGSLDERDFQREVMRKETRNKDVDKPTTLSTIMRSKDANVHTIGWLKKEELKEKRYKPS